MEAEATTGFLVWVFVYIVGLLVVILLFSVPHARLSPTREISRADLSTYPGAETQEGPTEVPDPL